MNNKINTIIFSILLLFFLGTSSIYSQCETWLAPSPTTSWGDFNDIFGGAPCEGDTGCEVREITDFEVFAAESYLINNFIAGGEYAFSMCNGPGAGTWVPEFTIVAPSGAIDAFGAGDGDSCTISWVASETGNYIIIINEQGACGTDSNSETNNGYPAITCLGNTPCPDYCNEWTSPSAGGTWNDFNTIYNGAPCDDGSGCTTFEITDFEVFASEAYSIDNFQEGGEYAFSICNGSGAGSWVPDFTVIAPSGAVDAFGIGDGDSCTISWTASESGTYIIVVNEEGACGGGDNVETNNGFPAITCLGNTECDTTVMMMDSCFVGMIVSDTDVAVCGDDATVDIVISGALIPDGGGIAYGFRPGEGGSGGNGTGFSITNSDTITSFDSGIGGLLAANGLPNVSGEWIITPFIYTEQGNASGSSCQISEEEIIANFSSEVTVTIDAIGGGTAVAMASGGVEPYTYLWSDSGGQTSDSLMVSEDGDYTVVVTDAVGCTAEATVTVMPSSIERIRGLEELTISPNPSSGYFTVNMSLSQVSNVGVRILDMTGKELASDQSYSNSRKVDFDLSSSSGGLYIVEIRVDEATTYKKILVTK